MTDDDRKLLERAARAAGYQPVRLTDDGTALLLEGVQRPWNPLHENPHSDCMGDALRLAAKKRMVLLLELPRIGIGPMMDGPEVYVDDGEDEMAAVCRAITRAAAEMAP